jgi:hypothetical protein
MAHFLIPPFGDVTDRQCVSLTRSAAIPGVSRLSSASVSEGKRVLMFTLQLTVGAAAAADTILALFAWTGAGL